jgi:hypothetical protein
LVLVVLAALRELTVDQMEIILYLLLQQALEVVLVLVVHGQELQQQAVEVVVALALVAQATVAVLELQGKVMLEALTTVRLIMVAEAVAVQVL